MNIIKQCWAESKLYRGLVIVLGTYMWTDPYIYFPLIMVMLPIFYYLLLQKLSNAKTPYA